MSNHPCFELLGDTDGFTARCLQPYGTEHSHHDATAREAVAAGTALDVTRFGDYVAAHGCGAVTDRGLLAGAGLVMCGDDYATAAAEVVARGLTKEAKLGTRTKS